MDTLPNIEVNEICRQLGMNSPKKIKQIYGGNIHSSWQIEFKNVKFFLKRNERKKKLLKFEEHCLKDMLENINEENLIIPKVYSYFEVKNVELLLIEWINMRNNNQEKLGKGLGEMHLKSNEFAPKKFGYPIEGYIGITNQVKG